MTALVFGKRVDTMTTCENPECISKGRRRMYLAGHPVPAETKLGMKAGLTLCDRCCKQAEAIWADALEAA